MGLGNQELPLQEYSFMKDIDAEAQRIVLIPVH